MTKTIGPSSGLKLSAGRTAVIGAMLVTIGPLSLALYTPALPTLAETFDTTASVIKLTLTVYFAGFTLAQLLCGPLSDAFGRRPVILGFFSLYLLGSILAWLAPSIEVLLLGRLVQGIGASSGIAVARAIVRDQFSGEVGARIMNLMAVILGIGPALSPSIGALTMNAFGWQAIFILMVVYASFILLMTLTIVPETNAYRNVALIRPKKMLASYWTLLRSFEFMQPALILGFTIGVIYTLASILPFVLIERLGLTPLQFGLGMVFQSGSFFAGGVATRFLLRWFNAEELLAPALVLSAVGGLALFGVTQFDQLSFLSIMIPIGVFAFGASMALPALSMRGMDPFPEIAGAASALMGFIQMAGGFFGSLVTAVIVQDSVAALGLVMPSMALIALCLLFVPRKKPTLEEQSLIP
ncbi:Inner membrane transport protein YdhC [Pseudovibrio axinellae]|uniref:Bcr/CflA family efflux transporter n=1 Tax=Pseudovibrio axinellae TaxID=989403 RepID=A0A165X3X4_9HYPH|nr:multidrug effflux MFS transporter [Pseudovibrio axinellae]KZL17328.1 Inner membrane transport protein YdhC [Pseudovibrio axinellae]SEQ20510.1 MFS transporter, DHA1 family, bicyclomycin/chloramphenicol resistance protein [Pseudovibrio axinellae]